LAGFALLHGGDDSRAAPDPRSVDETRSATLPPPQGAQEPATHPAPRAPHQRLEGLVLEEGGRPAEGATVTLKGLPSRWARTDRGGAFTIEDLAMRTYELQARKDDRASAAVQVHLGASSEPVVLELRPGAVVHVTVLSALGRVPVRDAAVVVRDLPGASASAGPDGEVDLRGLPAGVLQVEASAPGFAPASQSVVVQGAGRPASLLLLLESGAAVEGAVVDSSGAPVAGAKVRLEASGRLGAPLQRALTSETGLFRVPLVARGTWRIVADHPRFLPAVSEPFAADGVHSTTVRRLVLQPGRILAGRVRTRAGAPARGADVQGWQISEGFGDPIRRRAVTDDVGHFEVAGLPAGAVRVAASMDQASSAAIDVDLSRGDARDVELLLDADGQIAGVVVDRSGAALSGVQVAALPESRLQQPALAETPAGHYASDLTDGRGRFLLRGLADGDYRLRASRTVSVESPSFWLRAGTIAHTGDENARVVLDEDGAIQGRVVAADGAPPESFSVALALSPPVRFGRGGEFRLEDVPAQTHRLRIESSGFAAKFLDGVEVRPGQTADVGLVRLEQGRILRGRVERPDGTPVPDATILAGAMVVGNGPDVSGESQTTSDAQGEFALPGLGEGAFTVLATHPTEGSSTALQLGAGALPPSIKLVLSPISGIEGRITSRGVPVAGAIVVAFQQAASNARMVATAQPDGRYRFDRLSTGRWQIQASLQETTTALLLQVESADVEKGSLGHLDIDVSRGDASLSAKVLEADGAPLQNGQLLLSTGVITAMTGAQLDDALAARGAGQTRLDLLVQGRPVRFTELTPGPWSLCAIAVRGDPTDPAVVQRVQDNPATLPVRCTPVEVGGSGQTAILRWAD
jgi:hypothetical protein